MNSLVKKYYQTGERKGEEGGLPLCEVLFLSQEPELEWNEIQERCPSLPRGWFELSRLSSTDRVEFTRDFWLGLLPFQPHSHKAMAEFFECLDDIEIVLFRTSPEDALTAELVYSLSDNSCFFRGLPPAKSQEIEELQRILDCSLPHDYLSFLRLHNGFGKLSDIGILPSDEIPEARRQIFELLLEAELPSQSGGQSLDPGSLIPFYESFGLSSFQCFYSDWYPGNEMGNVYFSGIEYTISDITDRKAMSENWAFPTFLSWFCAFLEGMI